MRCSVGSSPHDTVQPPSRQSDTTDILRLFLPDSLARASWRKRLWLSSAGVAIFIGTLVVGYALTPKDPHGQGTVGLDFIAFYTAGSFVREGHARDVYDMHVVQQFQSRLARANGVDLGSAVGPYWNPPFYAWLFVPLSKLPYRAALHAWWAINIACAMAAAGLLCLMLRRSPSPTLPRRIPGQEFERHSWSMVPFSIWGLVPVLMALSTPFIHALSHAQNTCTSLLLVSIVVLLWRKQRAMLAGMVAGLLFYKPQLATVLGAVLLLDLGWGALAGLALTGVLLLGVTLALPGTLGLFLHRVPMNLHFVQCDVPYLWDRHVTFKAFWRLLLQGQKAGEPTMAVTLLASACSIAVGGALLHAFLKTINHRAIGGSVHHEDAKPRSSTPMARDRLIAATIVATPLLMPFYFDYDQLLLVVPAVLLATELMQRDASVPLPRLDVWLLRLWPIYYVWLMINPDVALRTHVNLSVPLLACIAGLMIARASRAADETETQTLETLSAPPNCREPALAQTVSCFSSGAGVGQAIGS